MKFIMIRKQWIFLVFAVLFIAIAGWYLAQPISVQTSGEENNSGKSYSIQMITTEFSTKTDDGKEIEAYRWDPGTIVVPQGKEISISIYGVNGKEHPFYIEGTDYKGTVQKGKETIINVKFDKEGTYRLICTTHATIDSNGPMIGYIIVD